MRCPRVRAAGSKVLALINQQLVRVPLSISLGEQQQSLRRKLVPLGTATGFKVP